MYVIDSAKRSWYTYKSYHNSNTLSRQSVTIKLALCKRIQIVGFEFEWRKKKLNSFNIHFVATLCLYEQMLNCCIAYLSIYSTTNILCFKLIIWCITKINRFVSVGEPNDKSVFDCIIFNYTWLQFRAFFLQLCLERTLRWHKKGKKNDIFKRFISQLNIKVKWVWIDIRQ
jgi:hypothetical protein